MTESSSNERVKINKKIGAGAESGVGGGVEGGGGTGKGCPCASTLMPIVCCE